MTTDELEEKRAIEKAELMPELLAMSDDDKRSLIIAASNYRSGEDSCNSVYMGGLALQHLRVALAGGLDNSIASRVQHANTAQLDAALDVCWYYIKYMREHPRKKCPCCGQVVPA